MDNNRKRKVLALSLGLALGAMMPKLAQAQKFSGGMMGYGSDVEQQSREGMFFDIREGYDLFNQHFGSDANEGYLLYNQTFGQEAPLGSGLFILTAMVAGYALRKRNNNSKNLKP